MERSSFDFKGYVMDIVQVRKDNWEDTQYPYNLDAVQSWDRLALHENVTFLVGENGSGKSTLIEAIAIAAGFNPEGGSKNFNFSTEESHSPLSEHIRLSRAPKRNKDGYFLRAESYFNVATQINEMDRDPYRRSPKLINAYGGTSLHQQSHGESFMSLLLHRFKGEGLYILDEPEAALSPQRQLAFLARMHDLVQAGSQFIIATHSPILMAYPQAWIYELQAGGPTRVDWENVEHVDTTRQFLKHPESYLRALLGDE